MNRSFKDYAVPGVAPSRSLFPVASHRRGNSLFRDFEERSLDLFSDDLAASLKLGKISVGSAKTAKSGSDDLLTSAEGGKHDYDWLLTPPETPLCPSEGKEFQQSLRAPKTSLAAKSISRTKSSRQLTNHGESNVSSRPARSSSVTRSSSIKTSSNTLNSSSSSVSSYNRPSSPATRSSLSSRPSTPPRTTPSTRSSTPSKPRPSPTLSSLGSRPSTPKSRPQIASNSNPPSRSSTPTRRTTVSSSASRPSSPSPRIRQQQPVVAASPDFSHDTPSNLLTSLPDRPVSVGRSRPSPSITVKANTDSHGNGSLARRAPSPIVSRGRSVEPKGRSYSYGHTTEIQEPRKLSYVPESPSRRNIRSSTTSESNGSGRSISKKSLDMAIKHMDIKNGPGNARALAGTILYPQSIRSASSKIHACPPLTLRSTASNDLNGRHSNVVESFRHDAIILKEDLKNTHWLLGSDEKSDQGLMLDHGFESLPEPFGLS